MTTEQLSELMQDCVQGNDTSYWQRFGFTVAGPLCYAYVKWISECMDKKYLDVTDVIFVARDGYLLKSLFDMLPRERKLKTHYVYATRAIRSSCTEVEKLVSYREYLESKEFGTGAVAVVDTATIRFSAQKLLASFLDQPIYGFYWIVLYEATLLNSSLRFEAFQKERYHTIDTWNIMEFIMSSPEPPIQDVVQGQPVYCQGNNFESLRREIFEKMSAGVFEFLQCMFQKNLSFPDISSNVAVQWINHFLRNPTREDIEQFRSVMFSMRADHSDCNPLNPFEASKQPAILRRLIRVGSCIIKPKLIRLIKKISKYK